ncbi:uncharacterized protein LOC131674187 isoform X3 [Phymastichus coffea]|uniref:uncharacterized protein LOC131674187 isoform X3 n=1 Tax=Phymastichus coffea TaxID=108790 RepID=UPI00273C4066|nr:uncharacterized protein LOC131674187 isoform X3 [Phymastichus coffea]
MAGALSESAPRPVSVVRVDGEAASSEQQQQQQQPPPPPPPPLASAGHDQVTVVSTCGGGDAVAATTTLPARSFASTEAQTEQLSPQMLLGPQALSSHAELLSEELRDARRRERRMRRQHRRAMQRASGAAAAAAAAAAVNGACAAAGVPPTYPGLLAAAGHAAVPPSAAAAHSGFLHPPPAHLGLRGLSLGLPFPVPASVSAFGRDRRGAGDGERGGLASDQSRKLQWLLRTDGQNSGREADASLRRHDLSRVSVPNSTSQLSGEHAGVQATTVAVGSAAADLVAAADVQVERGQPGGERTRGDERHDAGHNRSSPREPPSPLDGGHGGSQRREPTAELLRPSRGRADHSDHSSRTATHFQEGRQSGAHRSNRERARDPQRRPDAAVCRCRSTRSSLVSQDTLIPLTSFFPHCVL